MSYELIDLMRVIFFSADETNEFMILWYQSVNIFVDVSKFKEVMKKEVKTMVGIRLSEI